MLTRPRISDLHDALDRDGRRLLRAARAAAREQDASLWLVGGAVRDLVLGVPIADLDVVIDGDIGRFARACGAALHGVDVDVQVRTRFGTATLLGPGLRLDAARMRTESYAHPGALPRVRATREIERDLARRDFTVNAIALALAGPRRGELADPFGGIADLHARRLRVLHDRSFEDDATRIWRGARTAALMDLHCDRETAGLIEQGLHWLDSISGDRLRAELVATARRGRVYGTLDRLDRWGALAATAPGLTFAPAGRDALRHRSSPHPPVRLGAVLLAPLDDPQPVLDRLAFDRETRGTVEDTRRLLVSTCLETHPCLARRLEGVREEARMVARWLDPEGQRAVQQALRRWERTEPWLTAQEVRALGVPRGREVGRTLANLRRARYLGTLTTAAAARRAVREGTLDDHKGAAEA